MHKPALYALPLSVPRIRSPYRGSVAKKVLFTAVSLALLGLCVSVASAQKPADISKTKDLERTLMELQRQEDQAEIKKDFAALDRLLTDDFIIFIGKVITKAEIIAELKADKEVSPAPDVKYDDPRVRDFGNTAVIDYAVTFTYHNATGKEIINRFRIMVVWVKQKGQWKQAAAHGSPS